MQRSPHWQQQTLCRQKLSSPELLAAMQSHMLATVTGVADPSAQNERVAPTAGYCMRNISIDAQHQYKNRSNAEGVCVRPRHTEHAVVQHASNFSFSAGHSPPTTSPPGSTEVACAAVPGCCNTRSILPPQWPAPGSSCRPHAAHGKHTQHAAVQHLATEQFQQPTAPRCLPTWFSSSSLCSCAKE
jgi:hypothetical protein